MSQDLRMPERSTTANAVLEVLAEAGRPMTSVELAKKGVHRMVIKRLVDAGVLERVARGIYKPTHQEDESQFAVWAYASVRNPSIVFCLESAAVFHGMTQGMAPYLCIAIPRDNKPNSPELTSYVGARYFRWTEQLLTVGVDTVQIDGVDVKITSPERTVVDMFRYSSLAPVTIRTNRMIDTETFHDCLMRYFERHDDPAEAMKKLRQVAKPLNLWDKMRPQLELVAMTVGRDFGH